MVKYLFFIFGFNFGLEGRVEDLKFVEFGVVIIMWLKEKIVIVIVKFIVVKIDVILLC